MSFDIDFFRGKKVFITGHTGFKGTWLCRMLINAGADVTGYALEPASSPSLFNSSKTADQISSVIGDIRNPEMLLHTFETSRPEIVFHLAAQPIVRESYKTPAYTYETNVMGTVNILECVRKTDYVRSFINITTDKVYKNKQWCWGYRENDELNGYDPYSNSKSCSELVTDSYSNSFLKQRDIAVSTARAGNVIGGGDFSKDRIIPDCVRAAVDNKDIIIRNPGSVRPYQFVLEPLFAYLLIAQKQYEDIKYAGNYNIGPDESDVITTGKIADIFCHEWGNVRWKHVKENDAPHEDNLLRLDCSKIKQLLNWKPLYNIESAVKKTVYWYKKYFENADAAQVMDKQIEEYMSCL